jgi:calcium-binding protein CML
MQQINQMIADVDKDGSGSIDYEEFEHMMTAKIGERDTKEELTNAFDIIGQDKHVRVSVFFPYTHNLEIDVPDCTFPSYQM